MFDPVDPKQSFPALEDGIRRYWKEEGMFRRSITERSGGETFSFYDGPPFATGLPHYGHLLAGTIKDVIPRYQTMRGKKVVRRFGWDCHGLPIEALIEKEKGITNKKQIEEMGVANFNALCRGSVQRYTKEWRETVERVGRWVDMDHDYRTMDPDYMESIWWVFRQVYDKGLMYEGHKPMHVCPRCVTPLSNFEVTQGYKDVTDQSAIVRFRLKDEKDTYILAWTTTPWTLPGNLFVAVGADTLYQKVIHEGTTYIVAAERVETVFKDREYTLSGKPVKGKSLVGSHYEPLFPYFEKDYGKSAFKVVAGDFVTTSDGTGIVHIAPGFGEDDYKVGEQEGVPLLQHVTMDGHFTDKVTDFAGQDVKPADDTMKTDRKIVEWLKSAEKLFSSETFRHSYPHCWRCDSPLLNYATSSWFVAVEKVKNKMLKNAATTSWVPGHLRDGRFGKWLEGARDWAISRNRYWGTPLPVWRNKDTGDVDVIGGRGDLMQHHLLRFTKISVLRHAQSENNIRKVYEGIVPGSPLSALGRKQAKRAAEHLSPQGVDIIYASPLARTMETAQAIADATGATIIVDERLRELTFNEYEGTQYDFNNLAFLKQQRLAQQTYPTSETIYHLPGMEKAAEVYARISNFFDDIIPRHRSQHVVVVTHADPLLHARRYFTQEPHEKLAAQEIAHNAYPLSFFWDHDRNASVDLHKEFVDTVKWSGSAHATSVDVTLVRHGETDWNAQEKFQGGMVDNPLNAKGKEQAHALAKTLKKGSFDAIVCSTQSRAVETAQILAAAVGLEPVQWKELREREAGNWEGKTRKEVTALHPATDPRINMSCHYATPEGGESFSAFTARLDGVYERLLREFPGRRVLVVTHGGVVRVLSGIAQNLSYMEAAEMKVNNCEPVQLALNPRLSRITDVLDCWFESGSMPYAQSHYPFDMPETDGRKLSLPFGFPADFIAEGIDQTRLWFYTLMVLSTILFDESPYKNVVVNGIVLADDGRKMSKRLKNYPDPTELINKHGADALRFALMSSPAVRGEDLRFSEKVVEEAMRSVMLPLWNAYSFFVTYANSAGFEPAARANPSNHPLDRAMRAMMQDLVNRMTTQLDAYDLSATCAELYDTIDVLTNWYIRLSRRRFAGKSTTDAPEAHVEDHAKDQRDALTTLYDVLLTTCQLLAPFCPFATEAIYLNLVSEQHSSVHLSQWPEARALSKEEEKLMRTTLLLRQIVSLGLKVRAEAKIKVRQPLASLTVAIPESVLAKTPLNDEDMALIRQEVNVKDVIIADDPSALGEAIAQVNARLVGPKIGGRVQEIIAAGKRGDFTVRDDGAVLIDDLVLEPEEAPIIYRGKEGSNIAAERGLVVSLDTRMTDALKAEGLVRDVIRSVQKLRKDAGLTIDDRIVLSVDGIEDLLAAHGERIAQETLSTIDKNDGEPQTVDLDDLSVTIRFKKL